MKYDGIRADGRLPFKAMCNSIAKTGNEYINPFNQSYKFAIKTQVYVNEAEFKEYKGPDRMKYFNTKCPICGARIMGRPAEYPYYIRNNNRVLFVCQSCCNSKMLKIIPDPNVQGVIAV